ncbi:cobalt-precorrin 5A hydrolase [Clostridium chauvoei]|uniref:Cobalt-precorrin 5A hydrolase n=2 Tax=Clostridium chauvoei TaxID=46867 RepID=A0ABD4RIN4_9CLOT|nr:cobalt-precorrin 5A hydrolase [Clostridium chauvoei]ATD54835.1 cobalamin biosynthesis protein CbiG [Clostridium chauvoei]ATD57485.1 cobalamin biosynthesis protein CbiG [Clostridium chauvoei]MBX7281161.1 cobalt-precorrin 5A hydrolase [Clostridium chauvoei]MBX7283663.1 cobalt-precorrin 5A hydrolase [Clostridium chauvoei]MBX7286271.1 cobalt-precorrin 5A hydrolase [Clostridium chauvoei]
MIGIISVTEKGDILGEKIREALGGDIYKKSKMQDFLLDKITKECFEKYDSLVFISSTGIAVRAIANYLKSKDKDPAVVVVDVCNKFSISLVSGHLGGANNLAKEISKILNNTLVITTATDNLELLAPDTIAIDNNLIIKDLKLAKIIASKLVNNEEVYFKDDDQKIECPKGYKEVETLKDNTLWITNKAENKENILKLIRQDIILGVGCRKNTEEKKLLDFVINTLKENNLSVDSVKSIASIDIKKNEKAILNLSNTLNSEIKFFTKEEIAKVQDNYEGSDFVEATVGVRSVCEPVVELLGGKIIVKKIKNNGMTLAIGKLI